MRGRRAGWLGIAFAVLLLLQAGMADIPHAGYADRSDPALPRELRRDHRRRAGHLHLRVDPVPRVRVGPGWSADSAHAGGHYEAARHRRAGGLGLDRYCHPTDAARLGFRAERRPCPRAHPGRGPHRRRPVHGNRAVLLGVGSRRDHRLAQGSGSGGGGSLGGAGCARRRRSHRPGHRRFAGVPRARPRREHRVLRGRLSPA